MGSNVADVDDLRIVEEHPEGLYRLYESRFLSQNFASVAAECAIVHRKFEAAFPCTNSTASTTAAEYAKYESHEGYMLYNVFALAAPSPSFHRLYRSLLAAVDAFVPERDLYMQAWLNYQAAGEVLDWHSHEGYRYHGYIAVDPKETVTEFESYEILNKPGQIYIGRAFLRHRVVNKAPYQGKRITLGFDIIEPMERGIRNRGFVPLVL